MKRHGVTPKRLFVAVSATLLLAAGFALAPGASAQVTPPGAVIDNGTVQLGVHDTANLNFSCSSETDPGCPGPGPSVSGTSAVGLRFMQYNADGTAPGCLCEGWGAADAGGSGLSGFANVAGGTSSNLTVDSFTATETSAVSVVTISNGDPRYQMRVTHDYHPATGTPNLYEVLVTIENTGTDPLTDVRYRRVMDWDVEPTAFDEWVTIQGTSGAANLLFDSNDGFASANPLSGRTYIGSEVVCGSDYPGACDFVDLGNGGTYPTVEDPEDHGALFDFGFGNLDPDQDVTFRTYYGAAESESAALTALGSQSVEIYSLGQPNCPAGPIDDAPTDSTGCGGQAANSGVELGQPVTFVFAFSGVGGDPVLPGPLAISKEAADGTSQPGDQNGYTITIDNPNDEAMDADSISDTLPSGFSYVPSSTSGATTDDPDISGQTLTWDGPFSVPAEGSITLSFDVTVSDTPGEYDNEASVAFGEGESSETGPAATIVVEDAPSIAKAADDSTSQGGEQNGYTISITNPTSESGGEGEGFTLDTVIYDTITDELPDGFSYVPGSTTGLTTDDPDISGQTLTWDGPFFIPSESTGELHFNVIVSETPGDYDNEASANQTEGESLSTGPTATITVEEPPSIEKEADSATSEVGTQNGYTIFITNPTEETDTFALDTITYDSITDTLPAGFAYVPGSTSGLTDEDPDDITGQTLTWDGPFFIPSETTESLHFNVTVSGTPGQYFNDASVHEGDSELATGPTAPIDVTATQAPPQGPPPAQPLPCDPITAEGGPGGDRMIGGIGPDRIRSLAGRDIVDTGAGNDEICGGEGGDFLYGRADSDTIRGEGGNDRLYGGLHPDSLYGDAGHDALIGGKGADSFFAQDGSKDCIMTGKGSDSVTGDVGLDLVDPRGGCPPGFWV